MRVRIFIDFWNLTLEWNRRTGQQRLDWRAVPRVMCDAAARALSTSFLGTLQLEETRVYASYEPERDGRLKGWLHTFLDRQPGVRVFSVERHWRQKALHCRACGADHLLCPSCQAPFGSAAEKAVDSQIVTDLLSLAWEGAYDVALLVGSDRDFVPAVELLQMKNIKVINATWRGYGHQLAMTCWASLELDDLIPLLVRPGEGA